MPEVLPFLIATFIIASFLRVSFYFYLLYVLFGLYISARLWARRASQNLAYTRSFPSHLFLGEKTTVELEVRNQGYLPIPWVRVSDLLPIRLASPNIYRQVLWLPPKAKRHLSYTLQGYRRGYYPLGPLSLTTGDIWGIERLEKREPKADYLTVYPKIMPIEKMNLPSKSPLGNLRSQEHIYEDPARTMGVRDYLPGDSLRRIDWKNTARSHKLLVKLLEPAISVEVALFLNLNSTEYARARVDLDSELGVVAAASLANHIAGLKQAVGLSTNGLDPLAERIQPVTLAPRKERSHLMRMLEVLARIEVAESFPFAKLLREESVHLGWGVTIIVITPQETEELLNTFIALRRSGFHLAILYVEGGASSFAPARYRAEALGLKAWHIQREGDLRVLA